MGYIGNQTSNSYTSLAKQTITGDGGASYTLDHAVANEQEIEVFVNNVRQEPSVAYTVSGTALTMTGNVESSDDFYVVFQGKAIQTTSHPEGQDLKAREGTFSGAVELTGESQTLTITDDSSSNNVQLSAGNSAGYFRVDSGNNATSPTMRFEVGGSEKMRIEDGGNVGIGTNSPSTYDSRTNNLVVGDSGDSGITIFSGSTSDGRLVFATEGQTGLSNGSISYDQNADNMDFEVGGSLRMRINSTGNLLIGTSTQNGAGGMTLRAAGTDPEVMLNKTYSGNINGVRCQHNSTYVGGITYNNTSTAFNTSSDHRLKENVVDMTGAIARVKNLQPKRFNFIADDTNTLVDGFMAHEAQTVVPEAVQGTHNEVDDDGNAVYQGIDQAKLVPLLTGALQEAIAKIEALETRVQALEDA